MQGDLIEIANGAEMPDMPSVIRKLALAVVELQVAQNSSDKERQEKIRNFRGDASLSALLSDYTVAILKKNGITTAKQAAAMSDDELLAIKGVGERTLREIRGDK